MWAPHNSTSWAICPTTRAPLTCSSRSSAGATNGKVWSSRRTWRFRTGRPSSPTRAVPSRSSIASSTTPRSSPSRARVTAGAPPRSPARPPAPSRRRRDPRRRSKFPPFSEFGNRADVPRGGPRRGPASPRPARRWVWFLVSQLHGDSGRDHGARNTRNCFNAAYHVPATYANWASTGRDIRALNSSGVYLKHINVRRL